MTKDNTYNGWKNYEIWNVALWINNDEGLYYMAKEFMTDYKGRTPYADFVEYLESCEIYKTGDNVKFSDSRLSKQELNVMLKELR